MNPPDLSVYVVLDREWTNGRSLHDIAVAAVRGGATVLQLRDKSADIGRFYRDALALQQWARSVGVPLIVNDRVDIAVAVDADGVHVGEDDLPVAAARLLMGARKYVGASAGSLAAAEAAWRAGADHLGVGPVYEARATKPDADDPTGLSLLADIALAMRLPFCGIGGINAANAGAVIGAGAAGVAVISAVGMAPDVETATRTLAAAVRAAQAARESGQR